MGDCANNSHEQWRECVREIVMARPFTSTEVTLFTIAYGLLTFLGLVGNGLVVYVVISRPQMRTSRNVFLVNLALSNFLLGAIWIPFLWLPTFEGEFKHSAFMCKVAQAFPGINIYCSTLTISVIAVDRYFVVSRSGRGGPERMRPVQAVLISLSVWIMAFLLSLPYLLFFDVLSVTLPANVANEAGFGETFLYHQCAFRPAPCMLYQSDFDQYNECSSKYDMLVNILLTIFLYIVPLFVLITFNCMLTIFLKRTQQRTSALRNQANMLQPNYEPENLNQNANSRPTSGSKRSHHSRTSSRHNRTTALLIAMAVSYGVLWFPFIVLTLYLHMGPGKSMSAQRSMKLIDETCKMISMSSICVNPFLYGYLNTNFNREFKFIINALSMNLLFKWNFVSRSVSRDRQQRNSLPVAAAAAGDRAAADAAPLNNTGCGGGRTMDESASAKTSKNRASLRGSRSRSRRDSASTAGRGRNHSASLTSTLLTYSRSESVAPKKLTKTKTNDY